jgi:hypothetical protein
MRVRCRRELPTEADAKKLGGFYRAGRQAFPVTLGKEYIVFALQVLGAEPWVQIADDFEQLVPVPLNMFDIVDATVPAGWVLWLDEAVIAVGPPALRSESFHTDLLEGKPDAVAEFRRISAALESEDSHVTSASDVRGS